MNKVLASLYLFSLAYAESVQTNSAEVIVPEEAVIQADQDDSKMMDTKSSQEEVEYPGRLSIGGYYLYQQNTLGKRNSAFGEADLFIPLLQNSNTLFFLNVRGLDFYAKSIEGNFGLGVRHIFSDWDWLVGLYAFYDLKRSNLANNFQQITTGIEVKSDKWTFDANGYFPVGRTRKRAGTFDKTELRDGVGSFKNIYFVEGQEVALWGFDAEIGYEVLDNFSLFVGGFHFDRSGAKNVSGPFARLYWTLDTTKYKSAFFDRFFFHSGYSYDQVRGSRFYAGIGLSWLFGGDKQKAYDSGIRKRITEYVRRDFDVITNGNTTTPFQRLNNTDGSPVTVQYATDETTLTSAIAASANVIPVEGTITLTSGKLLSDTTLTGGAYKFGDNMSIQLSSGGKIIGSFVNAITIAKNVTVRDITFQDCGLGDAGAPFGTVLVDNIIFTGTHSNAIVNFASSSDENEFISIKNSTFTTSVATGSLGFISFNQLSTTGASITVQEFSNNTINLIVTGDDARAVLFNTTGTPGATNSIINIGLIENNTINAQLGTKKRFVGILLNNHYAGAGGADTDSLQILGSSIRNNTITMSGEDGATDHIGIRLLNDAEGAAAKFGTILNQVNDISGNTVSLNGSLTDSYGIVLENSFATSGVDGTSTVQVASLINNTITVPGHATNYGFFILNKNSDGSQSPGLSAINVGQNGGFYGNKVTNNVSGSTAIQLSNIASVPTIDIKVNFLGNSLKDANNGAVITEGGDATKITITP